MILTFQNGKTDTCTVLQEGKKWIYFRANTTHIRYRVDKQTGIVQVAPYWNTLDRMYVTKEA